MSGHDREVLSVQPGDDERAGWCRVGARVRYVVSSVSGALIDVASGEWCEPHPFADGMWRCVPRSFVMAMDFNVRYASSDCTGDRLLESLFASPFCLNGAREPRGLIVRTGTNAVDGYPRVVETFGVTGPVSPALISTGPPAACTAQSVPTGVTFYKAEEVLNPAEVFVSLARLSD